MSPIFNHQALHGLSNHALEHLRETLRQSLGNADLQERERANLHAALANVEAVLRKRHAPPAPTPSAPSP